MMTAVDGTAKRLLGVALVVVGLAADVVGILGNVNSWGATNHVVLATPPGPASPSTAPSTTTSPPSNGTTTTTTSATGETPTAFLDALAAAIRSGDVNFMLSRLNPAVVTRYGEAQCRAFLPSLTDVTAQFTVKQVGTPAPFNWATDANTPKARSTIVPNTLTIAVDDVLRGRTTAATVHVTKVGDHYTWFTNCGNPIGP